MTDQPPTRADRRKKLIAYETAFPEPIVDRGIPSVSDPTTLSVEGRTAVMYWPPSERRNLEVLKRYLDYFGLRLQETNAAAGLTPRRRWTVRRVDLDVARAALYDKDGPLPGGLSFDTWSKQWDDPAHTDPASKKAARATASVALSKLVQANRVTKRRVEGALWLFGIGPLIDFAMSEPAIHDPFRKEISNRELAKNR